MKQAAILAILASAMLVNSASAKWSRIPSADKKAVSMSTVIAGTILQSSSGISQANALILGDPVKPVKLATGKSEAILRFAKQSVINNVSFVSDGIEGKVAMSSSTDGKAWSPLDNAIFSPADRLIKLEAGAAQGRYLRLQFELIRGGVIRGFQAIGSDSDANYKVSQSEEGGAPTNFAAGVGGGRLVYISPELFGSRNDAIQNSRLEFPESDEKYRTAVYDLGQVRSLDEFGSVHSPRPVRFSVYAFETLPEKEDWRGRLAFDPTVFDSTEPVARAEDSRGSGMLTAKPGKVVKSRYIALRWEPDFNPPNFSAYTVSITGMANVTFSGAGVTVTTTTDSNGNTVATVSADGNVNLTITVDSNGKVNVQGTAAPDGGTTNPTVDVNNQTDTAETGETTINGVTIGAPSASGVGPGTVNTP